MASRKAIDVQFSSDIEAGLDRLAKTVREDVLRVGASAMSVVIYERARLEVPVRTGLLQANILRAYSQKSSTDDRKAYRITWRIRGAPHGNLIEFGTSTTLANPFMRRSFDSIGDAIDAGNARMKQEFSKVLG